MYLKHCKIKRVLTILSVVCVLNIFAWLYLHETISELFQYHITKSYAPREFKSDTNKTRYILLWNSFFRAKKWKFPDDLNGPSYFRKDVKCPVFDCVVTNRRDILPKIDMYDAILFHKAERFSFSKPKYRSWKQLYVFVMMDPPGVFRDIFTYERNFYNLTMTYRMDSDILWPYGVFVDKETGLKIIPRLYSQWRTVPDSHNDTTILQLWPYKNKLAAWFVSHCYTDSRREKIVKKLQKYITVDIFGKCGPKRCKKNSYECYKILDREYKFYFSFENDLCIDYMTEKVYEIMKHNIIPVVYGGANYERFLPPHSYINVEDFETPQELANYLKKLSKDPKEYMRYFWWRQYYNLELSTPFCDLCQLLHQSNYHFKTQTYGNIKKMVV